MNIVEKMTFFWISRGKVATSDGWGGQVCKIFTSNFVVPNWTYQKLLNWLIFDRIIQKIKRRTFGGGGIGYYWRWYWHLPWGPWRSEAVRFVEPLDSSSVATPLALRRQWSRPRVRHNEVDATLDYDDLWVTRGRSFIARHVVPPLRSVFEKTCATTQKT